MILAIWPPISNSLTQILQSPDTLPLHEVKTETEPEEKSQNGYVTVLKWVTLQAQKIKKKQISKQKQLNNKRTEEKSENGYVTVLK